MMFNKALLLLVLGSATLSLCQEPFDCEPGQDAKNNKCEEVLCNRSQECEHKYCDKFAKRLDMNASFTGICLSLRGRPDGCTNNETSPYYRCDGKACEANSDCYSFEC